MAASDMQPIAFTQEPADFSFLRPLQPTLLFTAFWRFAAERQRVFWRRVQGLPPPWTSDPVLAAYKFTNAYRASDRVSQYLIHSVIYEGSQEPRELFFRVLLFKLFNRVETWKLLLRETGLLHTNGFCVERYDQVLSAAMNRGERVYSAAYIMPSGGKGAPCARKHHMHLELLARMLRDELPEHVAGMKTMAQVFAALRTYPTIGDFLAYQYVTDLNYSTLTIFSETEFVVPGPGALSGLRKCFADTGKLTDAEVIRLVQERQADCFAAVGVTFPSLPGRALQLIDVQNLFCEVDSTPVWSTRNLLAWMVAAEMVEAAEVTGTTLFRGTSLGFEGSPATLASGVTPATTDPGVATIFATEGANYGEGVVHIALPESLSDAEIVEGNFLSSYESEVGVVGTPAQFAARSNMTITADQARAILQDIGISVRSQIRGPGAVQTALENTPKLTPAQIQQFVSASKSL